MKWQMGLIILEAESHGILGTQVRELGQLTIKLLSTCTFHFLATLHEGLRPAETALEDVFIRRFMTGTWHNLFASEVIIKRQHNAIRIAGIVVQNMAPSKMYWLIGYTEEMLSSWLQCPVKLELQTIEKKQQTIFKYI